jgi:hypothetical protein
MVITLYGSPIVNFLRNFSRDRTLPKDAVLNNWAKVYGLIDRYKKIPNIEYLLVQTELTPEERDEVVKFERAFKGGELEEYFKAMIQKNPKKYQSTFRKPQTDIEKADDLPDPETLKQREEKKKESEKRFSDAIKNLKDQFNNVEKYLKVIKPMNYKEAVGAVKTFAKP